MQTVSVILKQRYLFKKILTLFWDLAWKLCHFRTILLYKAWNLKTDSWNSINGLTLHMSKQIFGQAWIISWEKMVEKSDGTRVSRYGSWCRIQNTHFYTFRLDRHEQTNGPMDRRTDQWTDKASDRVACPQLSQICILWPLPKLSLPFYYIAKSINHFFKSV